MKYTTYMDKKFLRVWVIKARHWNDNAYCSINFVKKHC